MRQAWLVRTRRSGSRGNGHSEHVVKCTAKLGIWALSDGEFIVHARYRYAGASLTFYQYHTLSCTVRVSPALASAMH